MDPDQRQQLREQLGAQAEQDASGQATRAAQSMSTSGIEERIQNPQFLQEYTDPKADSDLHDWLEDEFGPLFSRAHVLGYRNEDYERKAEWLDVNKGERMVAEGSPGRILKEHPDVLAVMQGHVYQDTHAPDDRTKPHTQEERRVTRDGMEVVTQRKSLSVEGKGSENLTTATAENRVVRNEEEDTSATRKKLRSFFS